MARDWLHFPFTAADQATMTVLDVTDEPFDALPAVDIEAAYPQALRVEFAAPNPPRAVPLFPGRIGFVPVGDDVTPDPDTIDVTGGADDWPTRGWLWVEPDDVRQVRNQRAHLAGLAVVPNRCWIGPVELTEEFLLDTLLHRLPPRPVLRAGRYRRRAADVPAWERHAVAGFLGGAYHPRITAHSADPALDDAVIHPMPVVPLDFGSSGTGQVWLHTARTAPAQDRHARPAGPAFSFDDHARGAHPDHPAHPQHGAIPARWVYRSVRAHLLDAGPGRPVADAILGPAPKYRPIRFTRSWRPVADVSVHFPAQVAQVVRADDTSYAQRLPAHGVLFHSGANPDAETVDVAVSGTMQALPGTTPNAWRSAPGAGPVTLAPGASHVILRRRLADELLHEPAWRPGGELCTYLTLRRVVRAMIDNQITGGRLNVAAPTPPIAGSLLQQAWSGSPPADTVTHNRPAVRPTDMAAAAGALLDVLRKFFPDPSPGRAPDGSAPAVALTSGQVAYYLWQSAGGEFRAPQTKWNYPAQHIGRGAPGALEFLGLAELAYDPTPQPGVSPDDWSNQLANGMITSLQFPTVAQFWVKREAFEKFLTEPHALPNGFRPDGHSPLVIGAERDSSGSVRALVKIDQFGLGELPVQRLPGETRVLWTFPNGRWAPDVWIAARITG